MTSNYDVNVISLPKFFITTNPNWPAIIAFLISPGVVYTEYSYEHVISKRYDATNGTKSPDYETRILTNT